MQRCPLEILILKSKRLDMGEPKFILGLALDPPHLDNIEVTILTLKEVSLKMWVEYIEDCNVYQ